jgi:hypoxanthine phosphoribosyltransferase
MDSYLVLNELSFELCIPREKIELRLLELAKVINTTHVNSNPIFISVLNGSFIFAADLLRHLDFACEIEFVKVSSYAGTQSTGEVKQVLGLSKSIENRTVIILEDIIDSGLTIDFLLRELARFKPKQLEICTLLLKPEALQVKLPVNYIGFEVANDFLVGYGLDYDGLGRNLPHIYKAV